MSVLLSMFSYAFIRRALLVGILVSLCSAVLGVSLILKRYSMIGDGLSHVGFGALAVASALNLAPLIVAVPVVVLSAVLLLRLRSDGHVKGDAAIAVISSGALAVGVIVLAVTKGMNTELTAYMFGSILSLTRADTILSAVLSLGVIALFVLLYPRLFAITFDETFARATGTRTERYNTLLAILTAVTVVLGMRMIGALLIASLLVFPALSAMKICRSFRSVILCAAFLSVGCFLVGMIASYLLETPSGASVVAADLIAFALCSLFGKKR